MERRGYAHKIARGAEPGGAGRFYDDCGLRKLPGYRAVALKNPRRQIRSKFSPLEAAKHRSNENPIAAVPAFPVRRRSAHLRTNQAGGFAPDGSQSSATPEAPLRASASENGVVENPDAFPEMNGVRAATADFGPLKTVLSPSVCSKQRLSAGMEPPGSIVPPPMARPRVRCSHSTPQIEAATFAKNMSCRRVYGLPAKSNCRRRSGSVCEAISLNSWTAVKYAPMKAFSSASRTAIQAASESNVP